MDIPANELTDLELTRVCGGGYMSMVELQTLVAQRATALQMTSSLCQATHDSCKSALPNIGR